VNKYSKRSKKSINQKLATHAWVAREAAKLEKLLGLDFGNVLFISRSNKAESIFHCNLWLTKIIAVVESVSLENLKGALYHELGHALCSEYDLSSHLLAFTRGRPRKLKDSDAPPPGGFVSNYARKNREEDFCETFSAYLLNGRRTRGIVTFEGNKLNLDRDLRLKKKFHAVVGIIEVCANYEIEHAE
jgi:hypothetical protein